MQLTFGSVCSGIEAASVAWTPLGWRAVWLAEIEKFPSEVLAYRYPEVPNLGDMTKLPDRIRSGEIMAPDIFCGGTPCQAFSIAGLRKSLDDARGNLSLTFCEIANEIDAVRLVRGEQPATIFWENVPGVLSTSDNAFGCFLAGLAGEDDALIAPGGKWTNAGCVFGPKRAVAWRVFDAQYHGVAQRRRRVFVVASARKGFDPAAVLFEFDGLRRDTAPSRETREDVTHATAPCLTSSGMGVERTGDTRGQDTVVAVAGTVMCMAHGQGGAEIASERSPTLTCNHEAPIAAYALQDTSGRDKAQNGRGWNDDGTSYTLDAAATQDVVAIPFDTTQITSAANYSSPKQGDPCHPLAAGAHAPAIAFAQNQRDEVRVMDIAGALAAETGAKQQTYVAIPIAFPANLSGTQCASTEELSPSLGAMNPTAVATYPLDLRNALRDPEKYDEQNRQGVGLGDEGDPCPTMTNSHVHGVATAMQVRRLTPRECERLQGFQWRVTPDYPGAWEDAPGEWWSPDYTLISTKARKINPDKLDRDYIKYLARGGVMTFEQCCQTAADGPRYKALGNSWAVPNVAWIGRRIDAHLASLPID